MASNGKSVKCWCGNSEVGVAPATPAIRRWCAPVSIHDCHRVTIKLSLRHHPLNLTCLHVALSAPRGQQVQQQDAIAELKAGDDQVHEEGAAADDPAPATLRVVVLANGGRLGVMPPQTRYPLVKAVHLAFV